MGWTMDKSGGREDGTRGENLQERSGEYIEFMDKLIEEGHNGFNRSEEKTGENKEKGSSLYVVQEVSPKALVRNGRDINIFTR